MITFIRSRSRFYQIILKANQRYFKHLRRKNSYKVLFFGSDDIALTSLKKVNELRKTEKIINQLDLVTANNSKNKTLIEKYAETENLKTITWPLRNLSLAEYDIGLIVAFGHLIKEDVLSKFPLGMINVHPSLLPRWRGAAPIIHTLLHGDQVTGVSLMKIKPNVFDVGEIISQQKVPVPKDIRLPELTEQLSRIGADMLVDCMRNLPTCLDYAKPQSKDGVTYAKKINKNISEVRWSEMGAVEVYNLYRAIYGIFPLTTKFKDKQMKLFDAFLENKVELDNSKPVGALEYCKHTNSIKMGLCDTTVCRYSLEEDETPLHILCYYEALVHTRSRTLGGHKVSPEDIKSLAPKKLLRFIKNMELEDEL